MYIYAGEDILVRAKDIIAILDKESLDSSPFMNEFLCKRDAASELQKKGSVKSIIVTAEKIYYSPLATGTLKKRSQKLFNQEY